MNTIVSTRCMHAMPFGAAVQDHGGVRFALWAPGVGHVDLEHGAGEVPVSHRMTRDVLGWHCIELDQARAGDLYRYRLDTGLRMPDPASRRNPDDVHGHSEIVDPRAYAWKDADWHGRPWEEAVIYELHIGTFTAEGNFPAATGRLSELAELGITAVELMPLADFPGKRNWGYDGVLQFAPDAAYGTPDEVKAFVDAAHALGMMVLIDVVYNHFGPEGNYLHAFCPEFFNPLHQTPWGGAINYDAGESRTVRDFFVHNALYWVEEYRFDGLRIDAIHTIRDDSEIDIVHEICAALRDGPGRSRAVHVVLENELNQASFLKRDTNGRPEAGSAQWNDDLHHAAHVIVTGETEGYYVDYADAPVNRFGRALAEGFVYQGQPSLRRGGVLRGEPSAHLPPTAFVSSLQTHDQVGNRAFGERIYALSNPVLLQAAYACLLLSPHVPMLFMGEEYAASTPFLYFCDFGPELAEAVSRGRREEFGRFDGFSDAASRARIPDPNAESTFQASILRWSERTESPHREWLAGIQALLTLRRQWIVPHLGEMASGGHFWREGEALRVEWTLGGATAPRLHLLAHFGPTPLRDVRPPPGRLVHVHGVDVDGDSLRLATGAVRVTLQEQSDV